MLLTHFLYKLVVKMPQYLLLLITLSMGNQALCQPHWQSCNIPSSTSLRGIAAVSENTCWVSGSEAQVWLTTNGGSSWSNRSPKNYHQLQFRDIHAFNDSSAIILSAGLPALILKTTNAGKTWKEVYRNEQKHVFFDAMDFWDNQTGIAFSDAPGYKLLVIKTTDSGNTWHTIDTTQMPALQFHQGGFAASGTCLKTFGTSKAIIGLGGPEATVLLTDDFGDTWHKTTSPLDHGEASKGIFSFAFADAQNGFCTGGDYRADSLSNISIAQTHNGGLTWIPVTDTAVAGKYRSSIIYIGHQQWLCISRTGCSFTTNHGKSWKSCTGQYYSLSKAPGAIWASGSNGRVARWIIE